MRVDVVFCESDMHLDVQFESVQVIDTGGEPYEGAYAVTPKTTAQTLPTRGKRMAEDVVIDAIPERYGLITYDQHKTITIT